MLFDAIPFTIAKLIPLENLSPEGIFIVKPAPSVLAGIGYTATGVSEAGLGVVSLL